MVLVKCKVKNCISNKDGRCDATTIELNSRSFIVTSKNLNCYNFKIKGD